MKRRKKGEEYFGIDHQDHIEYLRDFFKSNYVDYFEENKHHYSDGNFELTGHLFGDRFEIQGGGQCIVLCGNGTWHIEDTAGG